MMQRNILSLNGKITFINDEPSKPSPNLPVSEFLAKMIEHVVRVTHLTVNINSTTGGAHSKTSFHYFGMAADINSVNGKKIDGLTNSTSVIRLQQLLSQQADIGECFGPFINIRKKGTQIIQMPQMKPKHLNYIHISSQR